MSKTLGVELSRITGGPVVNESLETNISGVFACGNVLHVHDLVDYVSEEAAQAGKNAVKYINGEISSCEKAPIEIKTQNGVRYSVPVFVNPTNAEDNITVRFRVANVFKNKYISVYFGGKRLVHRKKQILAPGEMENVVIKKSDIEDSDASEILITLEDE